KEGECRSSILLGIEAELFHARKESRAVHSQACGSTVGTTHTSLTCSQRSNDLIALLSLVFVSDAGFVVWRICSFSGDLINFMLIGVRELDSIGAFQFSERRLKRFAAIDYHSPLTKVFLPTSIP